MRRNALITGATISALLILATIRLQAQTTESKRFEVGAQFSALNISESFHPRTEPGVGGRFTYNLTDHLALEAEGNFFVRSDNSNAFRTGGRAIQGMFGAKVGNRYKTFGIFAKARPGFVSFGQSAVDFIITSTTPGSIFPLEIRTRRLTHFAADIGGVLEFYPSSRIVTRFDFGDTIIHYGRITETSFTMTTPGTFVPTRITLPSDTTHNFQFSAGVGWRF